MKARRKSQAKAGSVSQFKADVAALQSAGPNAVLAKVATRRYQAPAERISEAYQVEIHTWHSCI